MHENQENIIRWLHLSDFHVGRDDYGQGRLFEEILDHVRFRKADGFIPDLIFITGDVAYEGKRAQYKVFVSDFLRPLYKIVGNEKESYTFIVPGNHDVLRETPPHFDRKAICDAERFFDPTKQGQKERQQIIRRFNDYIKNSSLIPRNWINKPEGCYAERVDIRGMMVGVLGINTAWLSEDKKDQNKLTPGINLLHDAFKKLEVCNVKIVLGHHPIGWFRQDHISQIRSILDKNNALYLHGHVHNEDVYIEGDGSLCVQSGAAFITRDDDKLENGLLWAELDLSRRVLSVQPRKWNQKNLDWPPGGLPERRRIPEGIWWEYPLPYSAPPQKFVFCPSESPEGNQPRYQEQAEFIGRNREVYEFEQFLKSEDIVLNFHGISGIGKSYLLNRLLKDLSTKSIYSDYRDRVTNIDCKEINGDLQEVMRIMARDIGESRLPNYIASKSEKSCSDPLPLQYVDDMWDMLFLDLQNVTKTENIIILIDSFEEVQEKPVGGRIRTALRSYFGNCSNNGLKVVIGSQELINVSEGWVRLRDVEIEQFSREELVEFAENILGTKDNAVIDYLADVWLSDPLELGQLVNRFRKEHEPTFHLLAQLRNLRPECVAAAAIISLKGLRERLGNEDMGILSYCAVPRWFDASVIRAIDGSGVATSQSLTNRMSQWWFLKRRTSGGYLIHERYRGPLLRSLIQDDREMFSEWSKRCYEYLQSNETNMGKPTEISREIESVYHQVAFNAKDALLRYNELRYRFEQGNRLDLMAFLQDTILQHVKINPQQDDNFEYWVRYGDAMISYASGHESKALQSYEKLLDVLPPNDNDLKFLRARVLCAKGDLLRWQREETPDAGAAINCYKQATGLWSNLLKQNMVPTGVTKDDITKSIANTHVAIARTEETSGSLLEGMKHFRPALEAYRLCETLGPSYGRILKWMARNLRLVGKWKEAHRRFDEAEKVFNSSLKKAALGESGLDIRVDEINTSIQNVSNARAALWKEEGNWKEAKEVIEQVVAFHNKPEENKNQEELGIALIDLGDVLRMEENFIEAKQVYMKAQKILQRSERNKGYPLLGLAEIAVAEGNEENAAEYLSKAEEIFTTLEYSRKLSEIALCRAKISRKVNLGEALANLEKDWKWIRKITATYAKSAVLVELTELAYEAEHVSKRCSNYRKQAIILASKKQGLFADHLARLNFIDGCIAGEEEPVHALPAFIKAMAWAVHHNPLTLQRTFTEAEAWRNARLSAGTEIARGKAETLAQETEAEAWQSEEIALSALPEESQAAFKDAVKELTHFFVSSDM